MAQAIMFVCSDCRHSVEAWDDGNPYYIDDGGRKQYAYHPSADRDKCIGNDSPHICLSCGHDFMIDSRAPISACPECKDTDIVDTYHLNGKRCPYCKTGKFPDSPQFTAIS